MVRSAVRKGRGRSALAGPGSGPFSLAGNVYLLWAPLLLVLVLLLFADCGGGQSAGPSRGFLYTDPQTLELITWQQDSASLHGQWTVLQATGPLSDPGAATNGFTGQLKQQQVTITIGVQTWNGTLNGSTLRLPITTGVGQLSEATWYAGSQADYNELAAAFIAYHQLRAAQLRLASTVQSPPVDSDPASYDRSVQTARQYVANLQTQESMIAASADPCSSTGIFDELYPPDPSLFRLTPYATAEIALTHTELASQVNAVREGWQSARGLPLPAVPGLSLPWAVSAQAEQRALAPGQALYNDLLATLRRDYLQMSGLQQQSLRIGQEVAQVKQAHGCAR